MWIQDHCGGRWLDQSNPGPDVGGTDVGWKTQKMGELPSGKHTKNYGKSPFLMGKSTITGHFQ